jgi:hypothetical protein
MTTPMYEFRPFEPHPGHTDPLDVGADALLYVMAYGHTISVPTAVLHFAEKVAVLSIARRETPEPVLVDVNRAITRIAASLRTRLALDTGDTRGEAVPAARPPAERPDIDGGRKVKVLPRVPQLPPAGAVVNPF